MAGQWLLHHYWFDVVRRERVYVLAIVTLSLLACCNPSRAAAAASTTLCDASAVLADFTDPGPVPSVGGRYVTYSLNGDPVQQVRCWCRYVPLVAGTCRPRDLARVCSRCPRTGMRGWPGGSSGDDATVLALTVLGRGVAT